MQVFGCLLMGVFIGLFLLIGVVRLALRGVLGLFFPSLRHHSYDHQRRTGGYSTNDGGGGAGADNAATADGAGARQGGAHNKIFEKRDDEYVDFEEIKS